MVTLKNINSKYQLGDEVNYYCQNRGGILIAYVSKIHKFQIELFPISRYIKKFWVFIDDPYLTLSNKQIEFRKNPIPVFFLAQTKIPAYGCLRKVIANKCILYSSRCGYSKYDIHKNCHSDFLLPMYNIPMDYIEYTNKLVFVETNGLLCDSGLYQISLNNNNVTSNNKIVKITNITGINHNARYLIVANGYHIFTKYEYIYYSLKKGNSLPFRCEIHNISYLKKQKKIICWNKNEILWEININPIDWFPKPKMVKKKLKNTPNWMTQSGRYITIYDNIILLLKDNNIALLDLTNYRWYNIDLLLPILNAYKSLTIINGEDNYIYFLSNVLHPFSCFKINCLDIIPRTLTISHNKRNKKIIFIIIDNIQRNNVLSYNVPIYLKELIVMFFPPFLY